jgi:hypothetical protein
MGHLWLGLWASFVMLRLPIDRIVMLLRGQANTRVFRLLTVGMDLMFFEIG